MGVRMSGSDSRTDRTARGTDITPPPPSGTGAEFVYAIDPALSHQSIAFADIATDAIHVESIVCSKDTREGERLGLLYQQMEIWVRQLAATYPPAVIWIEQPSGAHANPQSGYAVGVIQAACWQVTRVPVWTLTSSAWKKNSLGYGNASKEQVAAWVRDRYGDVAGSQDECDAICMAYAGRRMLQERRMDVAA